MMPEAYKKTEAALEAVLEQPVLKVDGLTVSVRSEQGQKPLIRDISFTLEKGEILAIAGESGSGKSITSLAIMGLLPPPAVQVTGGAIRLNGSDLTQFGEAQMRDIRGNRIAMIFQEPMTSLNPVLTIGTQISEAIRAHTLISRREARVRALDALRSVRISQPEQRLDQYPHEFSGGMRQRVMIAMALALEPEVLIADEPTTALDVTVQREVLDLLRDLQAEHDTAILLITHDMGVVAEMADRVIVMKDGAIEEVNDVKTLFAAPSRLYTQQLLEAVPRMGDGTSKPPKLPAKDQPVLRLDNLAVHFDVRGGIMGRVTHRVHAVENVSFDIARAETFALVGESGCGKSTIARAVVGLASHTGRIEVKGRHLEGLDSAGRKALCRNVQMVFQDPMAALDPRMKVGHLIAEPLTIHGIGTTADRKATVLDLLKRVGLPADAADRHPHQFSGGQRQRICIARALALHPDLIIADESVSALDVSVQAQVLELLGELKQEMGLAYLFISHDMAVVENIADRVAVMYLGQIVEMGSCRQVFGNPQHPYTQRLIEAVPVPDPAHIRTSDTRLTGDVPSPVYKIGQRPKMMNLIDIGQGHLVAGNI
ncbi:ABC transporter ATP-binding protein [Sulfitobacter sp. SK011]|uniref:ABC transporter ATP-binding protein n=1 Tax=Sulfitobacter sp. SK011 TaxID=1389004 RepID=UPI000E0BACB2|nr:ABC transporter ATP-binding protein [Sulfitobacter sp. SK011]AXI43555.1 ABC transporter ATP-binding protein [Sulfitobacter sp. SK011]